MVNTLRITSIVAVVVAGLVLLLVVGPKGLVPKVLASFALHSDEETQRIISEPGAVEQWRTRNGNSKPVDKDATPPLVQQAELLKDFLVPKKPPEPPVDRGPGRTPTRTTTPVVSSARFDLVGISYEPANPQGSFAYILIKGDNTYQWVQVGDEIGHYTVKEVKPDSVVCFDGKGDVEIAIQPTVETSSLLEEGGATTPVRAEISPEPIVPSRQAVSPRITGRSVSELRNHNAPQIGPGAEALKERSETDRRARELIERMKEEGLTDPGSKLEDRAARVTRLLKEFKSSQVGPNEAKKLEDLGRELNKTN